MRLIFLLALLLAASSLRAESPFHLDPTANVDLDIAVAPEDEPDSAVAGLADERGDALEIPETPKPYASRRSQRINYRIGGGIDLTDAGSSMYMGGVSFEHFVADGLSLDFELHALGAVQPGDNAAAIQASCMLKWYFRIEEEWSLAIGTGIGLAGSTSDIPDDGSSFNFTPQASVEYSRRLDADRRLLLGVRWLHLSNANTFEDNPGVDYFVGFIGLSFEH